MLEFKEGDITVKCDISWQEQQVLLKNNGELLDKIGNEFGTTIDPPVLDHYDPMSLSNIFRIHGNHKAVQDTLLALRENSPLIILVDVPEDCRSDILKNICKVIKIEFGFDCGYRCNAYGTVIVLMGDRRKKSTVVDAVESIQCLLKIFGEITDIVHFPIVVEPRNHSFVKKSLYDAYENKEMGAKVSFPISEPYQSIHRVGSNSTLLVSGTLQKAWDMKNFLEGNLPIHMYFKMDGINDSQSGSTNETGTVLLIGPENEFSKLTSAMDDIKNSDITLH